MDEDDEVVWGRVRGGDAAALATLFDRYQARAFRHARRLLTTREDAKDAVTIAFFELWRKRRSVRLVDGSPLPWPLVTVAYSARNLERAARRYRGLLGQIPATPPVPPPEVSDEFGVITALRGLSASDQHVVVLRVLEGYSEADTARVLGVPLGTVKSRLARAKKRLRDGLIVMEPS